MTSYELFVEQAKKCGITNTEFISELYNKVEKAFSPYYDNESIYLRKDSAMQVNYLLRKFGVKLELPYSTTDSSEIVHTYKILIL